MALASDIMKGGTSAGQAKAINGQISPTVTAAGTTIADAFDLTTSINVVTTATANQGVQLPSAEVGDEVDICNFSGASIIVYPDAAANRINGLNAGGGFTLANNTACKLRKYTSTRWIANLSA
jgi:hypothetical protein